MLSQRSKFHQKTPPKHDDDSEGGPLIFLGQKVQTTGENKQRGESEVGPGPRHEPTGKGVMVRRGEEAGWRGRAEGPTAESV